ncbi:hypothetical protein [Streptomyces sp. NPDC017964]|uniref:hypothetical protein n=1 Tax=Streptomyces sp. NPDC017964 TaxID=3365022 RepID=UPI0037B7DE13
MGGIHYIVGKLEQQHGGGELVVTDQMEVASKAEEAADRIGAHTGDIFAVWSVPGRPNQAEAVGYVEANEPDSIWVISGEMPFEMADRYLATLRRARG